LASLKRIRRPSIGEVKVETILPVVIPQGKIFYAQGMKAGRWVFATGHMATDFKSGLAPEVLNPNLPYSGRSKNEKEGEIIFGNLKKVLQTVDSDLSNVVRLDQYYTTWKAVDPYHVARRASFGGYIAPSTSVIQKGLLLPEAEIEVQMIAVVPEGEFRVDAVRRADVGVPTASGFTPVVRAGDYIFVAGQVASWKEKEGGGIAPEAQVPSGWLWMGNQIKLETEYIIRQKLEPALKAAGSSLPNAVKAQVYMTNVDDFPAFNQVWTKYFPKDPPVTTLVPTAALGLCGGSIEINILALTEGGKTKKEVLDVDTFTGYENQSVAIRAGNLLFISGLMAVDRDGLIPEARIDARQPYYGSSIQAQMECILDKAQKICAAAGTSLENVVRVQQFHTDLKEFYPSYLVWQRFLPGRPLPYSAVQVPEIMPVPGCTVLLDLWVFVP
jgi:enamine deaminase RidA (YjgF/YER057c/UK114 family)